MRRYRSNELKVQRVLGIEGQGCRGLFGTLATITHKMMSDGNKNEKYRRKCKHASRILFEEASGEGQ